MTLETVSELLVEGAAIPPLQEHDSSSHAEMKLPEPLVPEVENYRTDDEDGEEAVSGTASCHLRTTME